MNQRPILTALGAVRAGVGGALIVAPSFAGQIWVGQDAAGAGTRVIARAIGARDVVLGARLLTALRRGDLEDAATHARTGVLSDVADVVATVIAARELAGHRRWAMPLIAAAVGGAGALVWKVAEEADAQAEDQHGAGDATSAAPAAGTSQGRSDGTTVLTTAEELGIVDQQGAVLLAIEESEPVAP